MQKLVLLSILPEWTDAILSGIKKWEYRRIPPKVEDGSRVILYASANRQAIVGEFTIKKILKEPIAILVKHTLQETPHNEEDISSYFSGLDIGSALEVTNPTKYSKDITLSEIREIIPSFIPPQSFRYLSSSDPKLAKLIELLPAQKQMAEQKGLSEF